MKTFRRQLCILLLLTMAVFGLSPAVCADSSLSLGDYTIRIEQTYINVPDMDVFLYATQPQENEDGTQSTVSISPQYFRAAGPELYLGDTKVDTGTIVQAADPICYMILIDNSDSINKEVFYRYRNAVSRLLRNKKANDQVMLFTTAGGLECMNAPETDRTALSKTLTDVKQKSGEMDLSKIAAGISESAQKYYQEMNPRKVLIAYTDADTNILGLAALASRMNALNESITVPTYILMSVENESILELLSPMMSEQIALCTIDQLGDRTQSIMDTLATALEIRTSIDESFYGTRLEMLTLSVPSLGSAAKLQSTVYMGYRLEHPAVQKVTVVDRTTLDLEFNQAVANADSVRNYLVKSTDVWDWTVDVESVELADDGRSARITVEPLYSGSYGVSLKQVTSQRSGANISDATEIAAFDITEWAKDRSFYAARFRVPLFIFAAVLILLAAAILRTRVQDRHAEKSAEVQHLLSGDAGETHALPRRMVTMFIKNKASIAQSRWSGIIESSMIIGSDASQCDLTVDDKRVGAQHCVLSMRGDALIVYPLLENNPVYVNGERIDGEHCLQNSDNLRIGKTDIQFVL